MLEVKHQVCLKRLNTWRVGGVAQTLVKPSNEQALMTYLRDLPADEPVTWLGLGSNVLIRDGGIPGSVIYPLGNLAAMTQLTEFTVRLEAGVTCAKAAKFAAKLGLTGLEFFAGIPGTVGGALAMNAGAFGGDTWSRVSAVEVVDRQGNKHIRQPRDYHANYREVRPVGGSTQEWFLAGHFTLQAGDIAQSQLHIKQLLRQRNHSQPIGLLNCGSVFRNPEGDHAARLIESCGLKGKQIGDAVVSEKHANFIINQGHATAVDVESLIKHLQDRVYAEHGIALKTEVHCLGVHLCG